jgi:hypothetical protein
MKRNGMAGYEVFEKDEAGNVVATYVASGEGRIDVIVRIDTTPPRRLCRSKESGREMELIPY